MQSPEFTSSSKLGILEEEKGGELDLERASFILSKPDLLQLIHRGQDKDIFAKGKIYNTDFASPSRSIESSPFDEELDCYLQSLASKYYL